jgi:hypothetical protein
LYTYQTKISWGDICPKVVVPIRKFYL